MDRTEHGIVLITSRNQVFRTVDTTWFNIYFCTDLGNIHDCSIAEIFNQLPTIKLQGYSYVVTKAMKDIYELYDEEKIEPDDEIEQDDTQKQQQIQRRSFEVPDERIINSIGNRVPMGAHFNDASDEIMGEQMKINVTKTVPRVQLERACRKEIQRAIEFLSKIEGMCRLQREH